MRKLFLVLTLGTCFSVTAQTPKTNPAAKSNPHIKVFSQTMVSGDVNTSIQALNYYIAEQGSNNPYADTLAMLYMQQGAYGQSYYWADKRLATKPDDNALLEMKGISLDKMNQPREAIEIFEKLFRKTQNPYHAYKLMELQYGIKRLAEAVATANAAERLQFKPEYVMNYNVGEQVGRTYLQAGIYNIHALALYDLDQKAEARTYFEKAVALDSNFVLARQNLEAVKSLEKNPNVKPTTPGTVSPANKQN